MQHLRAPPGRYAVGVADHVGVSVGLDRITIHHLVIIIIIYGHSGSRSYTPAGAPWGVPRDGADRITHTHIAHHRIIIIVNRSHHACHFCLKPFLIVFSKCFLYLMLAWLVAGRDLEAPVEAVAAAPVEAVAATPVAARRLEQGRPGALLGRAKAQLRRRAAELRVADRLVNPGLANRVSKDVFGVHGGELSRTSAASSFVANPDFFIKVRKSDQHRRLLQRGAVSLQRQVPTLI